VKQQSWKETVMKYYFLEGNLKSEIPTDEVFYQVLEAHHTYFSMKERFWLPGLKPEGAGALYSFAWMMKNHPSVCENG